MTSMTSLIRRNLRRSLVGLSLGCATMRAATAVAARAIPRGFAIVRGIGPSSTPSSSSNASSGMYGRVPQHRVPVAVGLGRGGLSFTTSAASDTDISSESHAEDTSEGGSSSAKAASALDSLLSDAGITANELTLIASRRATPLSLDNMFRYASAGDSGAARLQRLRNAQFLHRELQIRMAQRVIDLVTLPHGLSNTQQVRSVANIYLGYLKKFKDMPCPSDAAEEAAFTDMLSDLILDRTSIPATIARGVAVLKDNRREELNVRRLSEMEEYLNKFFTARVGLRFLIEHHVLSTKKETKKDELRLRQSCIEEIPLESEDDCDDDFLGCIQKDCDPVREARRVAAQVTRHCRDCYGIAPEVQILDCTGREDERVEFTYVPHHLQYMLAELLKNSCRATVRR